MKAAIKHLLCVAAMLVTTSAAAQSYTDTWWVPAESGWGVNITQQYNTIFLTFFVYNAAGQAQWYVGVVTPGSVQSNGLDAWSGTMYVSEGPYYGGPFNPALVNQQQVGMVSFNPISLYAANLSYTINGVLVEKLIQRETFALIPLGGSYSGGYVVESDTCDPAAVGGIGSISLALNQQQVTPGYGNVSSAITLDSNAACLLTGVYTQQGSIFAVANIAACATGMNSEAFALNYTALERTSHGIEGNLTANSASCAVVLSFAAVTF